MPKITTFLTFDGRAEEAANFYTSVFKDSKFGKIIRYGENAPQPKGTVMTVTFQLFGQDFVALNGGPSFTFSQGISLVVNCDTQEEIDYLWEKLSEDGVKHNCGWVQDKFGVSWQIDPAILPELMKSDDEEKVNRLLQAVWSMNKLEIEPLKQAFEGTL